MMKFGSQVLSPDDKAIECHYEGSAPPKFTSCKKGSFYVTV